MPVWCVPAHSARLQLPVPAELLWSEFHADFGGAGLLVRQGGAWAPGDRCVAPPLPRQARGAVSERSGALLPLEQARGPLWPAVRPLDVSHAAVGAVTR